MDRAFWLWEQLPSVLLLSPVLACVVSVVLQRKIPTWFPLANVTVALFLLGGLTFRLESDYAIENAARVPTEVDLATSGSAESAQEFVNRRADKQLTHQRSGRLFVVDGLNLWPIVTLVVVATLVVRRAAFKFVPAIYLFEASSIVALTANDLRVFLIASEICFITLGVLLGVWGGTSRRTTAERFLIVQIAASLLVMTGVAMLAIAVPWMKIEDSPVRPPITFELSRIVYEIGKWTTGNELAFQYGQEALPSLLLVMSIGLAAQCGLFPFHAPQTAIVGRAPGELASLYLAGFLPIASVGWWRFVLPLSPDLLVGFDGLILISTVGGAIWAALRALTPAEPRQKLAFIFVSLSAISFLGCHTFSRAGACGAWLMQQQLIFGYCSVLLAWNPLTADQPDPTMRFDSAKGISNRVLSLLVSIVCIGLFASGYVIMTELFRESIAIPLTILVVLSLCCLTVGTLRLSRELVPLNRVELILMVPLALVLNILPGLLLHQSEREFERTFRRFEYTAHAVSAEPDSEDRQSSP